MGILGIGNRTENWKTVEHFHGLSEDAKLGLVHQLLWDDLQSDTVQIELFWYGLRDWAHERGGPSVLTDAWLSEYYRERFGTLRDDLKSYIKEAGSSQTLNKLKEWNYDISSKERLKSLRNNLINTEVDIVLETEKHLFIGEAKLESTFGADSRYILVHQLIRQYVMATMLLEKTDDNKSVVPFVVGCNAEQLKRHQQVKFMICQGWIEEENVLSWEDIKELTRAG